MAAHRHALGPSPLALGGRGSSRPSLSAVEVYQLAHVRLGDVLLDVATYLGAQSDQAHQFPTAFRLLNQIWLSLRISL